MTIVNMRPGDIDSALALINAEGWGYGRQDLQRMLTLDPEGSFLHVEGETLGVVTSATYGRTGVIGHLVVSNHARGRRIGQALLEEAIGYCQSMGAETILLFSTEAGRRVYARFGFREVRKSFCTGRHFSAADHGPDGNPCTLITEDDLGQIWALDAQYFGDDRRKLLRHLQEEFPKHCWKLEREDRVVGFAMGRSCPESFDIGPVVCISPSGKDFDTLFRATLRSFGEGTVFMAGFAQNETARKTIAGLRSAKDWTAILMTKGRERYPSGVDSVYAITAWEFG